MVFRGKNNEAQKSMCNGVVYTPINTSIFWGSPVSPEETPSVYYLEYGGLKIDIRAPIQSYPGENITVTVKAEAITEIYVKYVHVTLYGALNATNKVTLREINHLENSSFLSSYEVQYNVTIPTGLSPGLTYGLVSCNGNSWVRHKRFPHQDSL